MTAGFENVNVSALLQELGISRDRAVELLQVKSDTLADWQARGEMPKGVRGYLKHLVRGGEPYRELVAVSLRDRINQ
ncbi:MAG: hypothetical protein CEO12_5 [Parcubacteria group bacterium Gr01-1014_46]|nr:MAG: hypothetical protein CEO12_5 [Parcubacteria group bacterium Gr01-1014_46]